MSKDDESHNRLSFFGLLFFSGVLSYNIGRLPIFNKERYRSLKNFGDSSIRMHRRKRIDAFSKRQ
jgi:hypothetical protein